MNKLSEKEVIKKLDKWLKDENHQANACKENVKDRYFKRIKKSNIDEFEAFFEFVSKRFDISKAGPVGNTNIPGVGKPKTWEFYFTNYCYNRINFLAIEQRE